MKEVFVKPAVGAIIEKEENGKHYILIQTRQKEDDYQTNGLIEFAAGKIREYENIFEALKREVKEETGLVVTEIFGEACERGFVKEIEVIGFNPFCVTQNLNGIYSVMMMSFICHAEGTLLESTDETADIHWESIEFIEDLVENHPEKIFPLDVFHLKKYLSYKKQDLIKEQINK